MIREVPSASFRGQSAPAAGIGSNAISESITAPRKAMSEILEAQFARRSFSIGFGGVDQTADEIHVKISIFAAT